MPLSETVPESWRAALGSVLASAKSRGLGEFLGTEEAAGKAIFPPRGQRLAALELTPLDRVKVVILGQDPYHGAGQASFCCGGIMRARKRPAFRG